MLGTDAEGLDRGWCLIRLITVMEETYLIADFD